MALDSTQLLRNVSIITTSTKHWTPLADYLDHRIEYYKHQLTQATNFEQVKSYQGAIEELKRLRSLDVRIQDEKKKVLENE